MRVKVGNVWHEASPNSPIAIELSDADKRNIAAMHPECSRYGVFAESGASEDDRQRMHAWLGE